MLPETLQMIVDGGTPRVTCSPWRIIARHQAAKKTSDLIPLCHPLMLTGVKVELSAEGEDVCISSRAASCPGRPGSRWKR
jgi:cyclic pyranopterin phosphate synthase